MTYTGFALEWAQNHEQLFRVLASLAGILSFLVGAGWMRVVSLRAWRRELREYQKMENPGVVVFEGHVLTERGRMIRLEVDTWGGKHTLEQLLHDSILERIVERAAKQRKGFLELPKPGQLMFLDAIKDTITGNRVAANLNALMGRYARRNHVVACPVTWPGIHGAHLIRVVIVSCRWMDRLRDPSVIARIRAADPRYQNRADWLHQIALRWPQERYRDDCAACMRLVVIKT